MSVPKGHVAVVGTGVIGMSWAALFLAHGHRVVASDPSPGAEGRLVAAVEAAWPVLHSFGAPARPDLSELTFTTSAGEAASGASFVQESGPEDLSLKATLMAELDSAAHPEVVIASSSSGLLPSAIQATCPLHPERVLVGHPYNPPHLVPLVEVVGGTATSQTTIDAAMMFYRGVGKRPVQVRRELPGHLANRLQAALWREAFWLVQSGAATVTDIDTAITAGPGLRWAAIGPFVGLHLSGGDGGIQYNLEHLGPAMSAWWETLGSPTLDAALIDEVAGQLDSAIEGRTSADIAAARDRFVAATIEARAAEPDLL